MDSNYTEINMSVNLFVYLLIYLLLLILLLDILYKEGDDIDLLIEKVIKNIELYEERHDKSEFLNECKKILLSNVDEAWMKYLSDIDVVRQGINLRSYKQVNPVQIFIIETSELFNEMTYEIKEKTTIDILEKINI